MPSTALPSPLAKVGDEGSKAQGIHRSSLVHLTRVDPEPSTSQAKKESVPTIRTEAKEWRRVSSPPRVSPSLFDLGKVFSAQL